MTLEEKLFEVLLTTFYWVLVVDGYLVIPVGAMWAVKELAPKDDKPDMDTVATILAIPAVYGFVTYGVVREGLWFEVAPYLAYIGLYTGISHFLTTAVGDFKKRRWFRVVFKSVMGLMGIVLLVFIPIIHTYL